MSFFPTFAAFLTGPDTFAAEQPVNFNIYAVAAVLQLQQLGNLMLVDHAAFLSAVCLRVSIMEKGPSTRCHGSVTM